MRDYYDIFLPEATYHVYNRADGSETLFSSASNYKYFLEKYHQYISPRTDTFCYCLMPNHFHFVLRLKAEMELHGYFMVYGGNSGNKTLRAFRENSSDKSVFQHHPKYKETLAKLVSLQFSHFFNCYSQSINKERGRMGGLFMRPYKRIQVNETKYLLNLVLYVHRNPVDAGLAVDPGAWPYSSYKAIVNNDKTFLMPMEVIDLFGDQDNFISLHKGIPHKVLDIK